MKNTKITQASLDLLLQLIEDSGNWSNNPMLGGNVTITQEGKGHLTHLKKNGLLSTFRDDGWEFISFKFTTGDVVTDGARSFTLTNGDHFSKAEAL